MESPEKATPSRQQRIVSHRLSNGSIVETIYCVDVRQTKFAIYRDNAVLIDSCCSTETGEKLEPVPASNNLIKHGSVVLPGNPEPYDSIKALVATIQEYIHRYVDLSDNFCKIASYYVLLSWVYDAFNELPYLRLRGDFGSGKTRALLVIGSICNKAFFASGASTVSPIFHTLDLFRGTLVFDEADFRFSDEKSELVKIFNNGNVRGFPVLRTAVTMQREFDPRAFAVFGPKIVAMRRSFDDPALESRFLTEEMGQRSMRKDIPINLPDRLKDEALALRNKLLMYRFRTIDTIKVDDSLFDPALSPRLNQILIPLLSIIDDVSLRHDIREAVRAYDQKLYAERSQSPEAGVLEVLQEMYFREANAAVPVSEIAKAFAIKYSDEYERPITARFIGGILRKRLRLVTFKSHGVYVLPVSERPKVAELCIRYGVSETENESNSAFG